jgi:CheY-like chemotaxis protein
MPMRSATSRARWRRAVEIGNAQQPELAIIDVRVAEVQGMEIAALLVSARKFAILYATGNVDPLVLRRRMAPVEPPHVSAGHSGRRYRRGNSGGDSFDELVATDGLSSVLAHGAP